MDTFKEMLGLQLTREVPRVGIGKQTSENALLDLDIVRIFRDCCHFGYVPVGDMIARSTTSIMAMIDINIEMTVSPMPPSMTSPSIRSMAGTFMPYPRRQTRGSR